MPVVYQYPHCGTCRKALHWLDEQAVSYEAIDIVKAPPAKHVLAAAIAASGLPIAKFFNTSGQSYRDGGFKDKLPRMTEAEAITALAQDGKLIKRPLVLGEGFVLVGFKEQEYARRFL